MRAKIFRQLFLQLNDLSIFRLYTADMLKTQPTTSITDGRSTNLHDYHSPGIVKFPDISPTLRSTLSCCGYACHAYWVVLLTNYGAWLIDSITTNCNCNNSRTREHGVWRITFAAKTDADTQTQKPTNTTPSPLAKWCGEGNNAKQLRLLLISV